MAESRWVLILGETEISGAVVSVSIKPAGPSGEGVESARVIASTATLLAAKADYQAGARLFSVTGAEREIQFTGIVDTVTPMGYVTEIRLVHPLQMLAESGTGGLGMDAGTAPIEAAWSLLRLWGVGSEQINIEGFEPGPEEMFEVAVSLDSVTVAATVGIGEVLLLPHGLWSRMADGLEPVELWRAYAEASAWALTIVQARTFYEAETKGLRAVDVALAWLTSRAHYSTSELPGEQPRRFRRSWTLSRVTRRDVVVVKRSSTGDRWLRAPKDVASQPTLVLEEMEDLRAVVPFPASLPVPLREALLAWRRVAESDDPFAAVVALWECIEFYTADTKVAELFTRAELATIRESAIQGLAGAQRDRVREVLDMLKDPSAMLRLAKTLEDDRVPLTEEELKVLKRIRKVRNNLIHGRSKDAPSSTDLKHATALVARMLVHRVSRLGEAAGGQHPGSPKSI